MSPMRDNGLLQGVVLGFLQGLTEFFPISSSAHLIVVPWLLEWSPMGLAFDVMVHLGTLLSVLIYFRRDWWRLIQHYTSPLRRKQSEQSEPLSLALILGTLPCVLVGGLLAPLIEEHLRGPLVAATALSVFGLILLWADRSGSKERSLDAIHWRDGLLVGIAQILAFIPGVSRSGITVSAALLLGLKRPDSARFSFLLAAPVIALAGISQLYSLFSAEGEMGIPGLTLLLGVSCSSISGFLCIKYFLRFLEKGTLLAFVAYRLLLSAFIFALTV